MDELNKISRRKVIAGLSLGLTSVMTSPVLASDDNTTKAIEDPVSKYPKPPFKSQSQPWPGLAGKMEPKPDHGEKSYK